MRQAGSLPALGNARGRGRQEEEEEDVGRAMCLLLAHISLGIPYQWHPGTQNYNNNDEVGGPPLLPGVSRCHVTLIMATCHFSLPFGLQGSLFFFLSLSHGVVCEGGGKR